MKLLLAALSAASLPAVPGFAQQPPVIARIERDRCCLDPRTVLRSEDEPLFDAVEAALHRIAGR